MSENIGGNVQVYNKQEDDLEDIILRRADPDDFEQIINLVECDDIYNRFYSFPKILKLIETSYLSIVAMNREGNIIAFAAFEDFPQGLKENYANLDSNFATQANIDNGNKPQKEGSYRDRDSIINNSWEAWFNGAFELSEFNSANTLWMAYYASLPVGESGQDKIFKKVLQTLYTSLPEIIGVLFLMKGDAEEDDIRHCFGPLNEYYEKIQCKNREALKQVRGVHYNSEVFFSSRLFVLPFVEIRVAKQEDHDDLAAVFNSQSHTVTEIYGDYFLAELIAAQDETNKALTAQVKDQAIGLMALTSDLDVKLLHQCFELGLNDNLYKPEFMDAVNRRRELLLSEQRLQEKEAREEEQRKLKEATMRCNIISQRIALQEYLISKEQDIKERIEKVLKEQEEAKNLTRKDVEDMLDEFLEDFETPQASDYFFSNPSNDSDLCTNIQPKRDFLLSCLEIFGLPVSYMDGVGHFPNFGKKDNEKSAANVMKGLQKKKQKKKTPQVAKMIKGLKKQDKEEKAKLTHFDLEPALHAIKDFLQLNSEVRSQMRMDMKREADSIEAIFVDEHGERSFKQCVDIMSFEKILTSRNVPYSHAQGTTGKLLRCFGELAYQLKEVIKMPEKDPKEIAKELARKKAEKEEKGKEEKDGKKPRAPSIDEDSDEQKKQAPPQCINVKLYETSIHDMYQALEKSRDYDFTLETLGIVKTNLDEERVREGLKPLKGDNSDFENEKRDKNTSKQNEETIYSDDPEYNEVVKNLNDLETIPDPPPKARNAFAVTLFCIDSAFESRSRDFLSYAFDLFPDRDYLILTQPHTAPESTLLQKFTLVSKKPNNTFPHALYILHRDALLDIAMHVRRAVVDDLELINDLIAGLDNEKAIQEDVYNSVVNPDTKMQTYISKIASTLTGIFVTSKDVNLEYYRSHFHIQDSILLNEHDRRGHTRIIHSVVNPIYERSTRFCLKEILRLSGKTCLYFEISNFTVIPQIFQELINVRTRRFPRFLKRRLDIEALQHEKIEGQSDMDMGDRDPFDAEESAFALWFTTRRLLSEPKIVKNSRIVVVGASDTGVSFIEALLSVSYLRFTNIVLISPGGLPHHHFTDPHANLKAYSTSYTNEELKLLMLENRVKVINARKVDIDRSSKHIILHDGSIVPYDTLVLTMGLQEQTLNNIGNTSPGFALSQSGRDGKEVIDGLLSIDDPFLYHYLRADGPLVSMLCNRKKKNDVVIYGRTLDSYCCIQGLINRGVKPENVILVIPEPECHVEHDYDDAIEMNEDISFVNPEAFTDQTIRQKIHDRLISMGVTIYEHCRLQSIEKDDTNCLKSAIFKRLDIVEEDVEDLANNSRAMNEGEDNEDNLSAEGEEVHVVK